MFTTDLEPPMPTYYVGRTQNGDLVSRASTRPDYCVAAVANEFKGWKETEATPIDHKGFVKLRFCNFSTSLSQLEKNLDVLYRRKQGIKQEWVPLKKVDAKEFRSLVKAAKAQAGI